MLTQKKKINFIGLLKLFIPDMYLGIYIYIGTKVQFNIYIYIVFFKNTRSVKR